MHKATILATAATNIVFAVAASVDNQIFVLSNFAIVVRLLDVFAARLASYATVSAISSFDAPNLASLALVLNS